MKSQILLKIVKTKIHYTKKKSGYHHSYVESSVTRVVVGYHQKDIYCYRAGGKYLFPSAWTSNR